MTGTRVLRTGAGSLPSAPVIVGLRELGCTVIAADADPLSVGFYDADAAAVIPRADAPEFVDALLDLCARERIDTILPAVNEEIVILTRERERFAAAGVSIVAPESAVVEVCLDKLATVEALRAIGVEAPETRVIGPDLEAADSFRYPAIAKPRAGRGSRGVAEIADAAELRARIPEWREPMVLQERLDGDEYTIDLLADAEGQLCQASVRRRLKVNAGISVAGEIVSPEPFIDALEVLTRELRLVGPSCVQGKLDAAGRPCFYDINPRLGGGVALSLRAGTPILAGILALLRGDPIPRAIGAGVGTRFLRKYEEVYLDDQGDRL